MKFEDKNKLNFWEKHIIKKFIKQMKPNIETAKKIGFQNIEEREKYKKAIIELSEVFEIEKEDGSKMTEQDLEELSNEDMIQVIEDSMIVLEELI